MTLQALVDATPDGFICVAPGSGDAQNPLIYRELVTLSRGVTLEVGADVEVRGSDVWAGWSAGGGYYTSSLTVPALSANTNLSQVSEQGSWPEQVFLTETATGITTEATQLAAGSTPGALQFCLVSSGDRHLRLGLPAGKTPTEYTIEVTTRQHWVRLTASDCKLTGKSASDRGRFRHAAPPYQRGGVDGVNAGNTVHRLVVKWIDAAQAHTGNIALYYGQDHVIEGVWTHHAGQLGIDVGTDFVTPQNGLRVTGCLIEWNNTYGNPGWHSGGGKFTKRGGVTASGPGSFIIDFNVVRYNTGPGLWLDTDCYGFQILSNRVYRNSGPGIWGEVLNGASGGGSPGEGRIWNNAVFQNGGSGIWSETSKNVSIKGNTIAWNGGVYQNGGTPNSNGAGIDLHWDGGRAEIDAAYMGGSGPVNLSVRDNVVAAVLDTRSLGDDWNRSGLLFWREDPDGGGVYDTMTDASNTGGGNQFYLADPTTLAPVAEGTGSRWFETTSASNRWDRPNSVTAYKAKKYSDGTDSRITAKASLDTLLLAAGVPTTPLGDPPASPLPVFLATYSRRRRAA